MENPIDILVEDLGGTFKVAALVGLTGQAVSMWRSRGAIPPEHYFAIVEALEASGKPPPSRRLFGFPERPTIAAQ